MRSAEKNMFIDESFVWVFKSLKVYAGCLVFKSKIARCKLLRKILWDRKTPILHRWGSNTRTLKKKKVCARVSIILKNSARQVPCLPVFELFQMFCGEWLLQASAREDELLGPCSSEAARRRKKQTQLNADISCSAFECSRISQQLSLPSRSDAANVVRPSQHCLQGPVEPSRSQGSTRWLPCLCWVQ